MKARKTSGKANDSARKGRGAGILERLAPEEGNAILRLLLEEHPELRTEAEQLATDVIGASTEEVADNLYQRLIGVDLDALNERAGAHSWGYVEPSEAGWELLGEEVDDFVSDMKRKAELGLVSAAETVCVGIVEGLYRARGVQSDGALGWAPDFPVEKARSVLREFVESVERSAKGPAQTRLREALSASTPEWMDIVQRAIGEQAQASGQ